MTHNAMANTKTKYQRRLIERMKLENLHIVCVDDDYEGLEISLSDDYGNYFARIQERTLQSLLDQELLDVRNEWRPAIHIYVTEYIVKPPQGETTK